MMSLNVFEQRSASRAVTSVMETTTAEIGATSRTVKVCANIRLTIIDRARERRQYLQALEKKRSEIWHYSSNIRELLLTIAAKIT